MSLVSLSITGSILIIVVSIIRSLSSRRLPARFFVLLWMIISLRMLIPWSFAVDFGLVSPLSPIISFSNAEVSPVAEQNSQSEAMKQENTTKENIEVDADDLRTEFFSGVQQGQNALKHYKTIIWMAWMGGVAACLAGMYFRGHKEHQVLKEAIPLTKEELQQLKDYIRLMNHGDIPLPCFHLEEGRSSHVYYVSDRIRTPVTVGIFRPRIVLSRTMTSEEPGQLMYVLLHECVHVRRKDTLMKAICLAAACVHWFNPFGWIMFHFLKQDIEFACDEAVIQIAGSGHRKKYANSIVLMASSQEISSPVNAGFSVEVLKRRIIHIMKYKKFPKMGSIGCVVFLIVFTIISFARGKVYAVQDTVPEETVISETEPDTPSIVEDTAEQWIKRIYYNSNGEAVTEEENVLDDKGRIVKTKVHHTAGVPEGSITEYTLDSSGRRLKGQVYREDGSSGGTTMEYSYMDSSDRVSGILINGSSGLQTEEYQYDPAGNVITCTVKNASGNEIMNTQTVNTYDESSGQLEKSESVTRFEDSEEDTPRTIMSIFQYDDQGRVIREDLYNEGNIIGHYEYYY